MALKRWAFSAVAAIQLNFGAIPANGQFDPWYKKTVFRIDHQIEVPGMILEPGGYVFRIHQNVGRRSVIEVLTEDETTVLIQILAIPDHRLRPEGDIVITYHEVPAGKPKPVQSWFYPGDLSGLEFVYPKNRAKTIAKVSGQPVMAADLKKGMIVAITATGTEIPLEEGLLPVKENR